MKKNLLFQLVCFLSIGAFAQDNLQRASICESAVGNSPNQLTSAFGHKTNLWYDKDVDVLSFVFSYDTASIGYAYSSDHGATWTVDTMLYQAPNVASRGRYPQGLIYNPAGNTNPANAYVTCFGPTSSMNAHYEGTAAIGSGVNQQNVYPFSTYPKTLIPQGGTIVKNTGTTWWSAAGTTNGTEYNDTIVLAKGTFGGGNFSYSYTLLPVPVCTDNNGLKMFRNQAIIFDDSGQLGYVVVIGNDVACIAGDSAMGLIIFKTTDGGNTWNLEANANVSDADPLLMANGSIYSASTELDLAMDQSNTLHIGLPIIPFTPGNLIYNTYPTGTWGLFDVSYDGLYIRYCLIAEPQQYYGQFIGAGPILNEDNRFQLSRNWDGTRIFYTWFDTDTITYGTLGNLFPDMHSVGYDLASNLYSPEVNFTQLSGTSGDGNSIFGNVSYYTINDGVDENIPVVSDVMISAGLPIGFFYIGCAPLNNYVNSGHCIIINMIKNPVASNSLLEEYEIYPNPLSQNALVEITLSKSVAITIQVTNALGQVYSSVVYKNLHAGRNTITLEASSLSKGLYFYTIKADVETTTKMVSVE